MSVSKRVRTAYERNGIKNFGRSTVFQPEYRRGEALPSDPI